MFYRDGSVQFCPEDHFRRSIKLGRGWKEEIIERCISIRADGKSRWEECQMDIIISENNIRVEFYIIRAVQSKGLSPDEKREAEECFSYREVLFSVNLPANGKNVSPDPVLDQELKKKGFSESISQWKERHEVLCWFEGYQNYYSSLKFFIVYDDEIIPEWISGIQIKRVQRTLPLEIGEEDVNGIWLVPFLRNEAGLGRYQASYQRDHRYVFGREVISQLEKEEVRFLEQKESHEIVIDGESFHFPILSISRKYGDWHGQAQVNGSEFPVISYASDASIWQLAK